MKYVQQYCLIDDTTPHIAAVNACTSACTVLSPVLNTLWINSHPYANEYDYCSINSSLYPQHAANCAKCLQSQKDTVIIGNFVDTMNQACISQPYAANGNLITTTRALFDTSIPTSTPTSASQSSTTATTPTTTAVSKKALGTGAVAGIAVAAVIIGLGLIIGIVVFMRRNRKQQQSQKAPMPPELSEGHVRPYLKDGHNILEKPAGGLQGQIHEAPNYSETHSEVTGTIKHSIPQTMDVQELSGHSIRP